MKAGETQMQKGASPKQLGFNEAVERLQTRPGPYAQNYLAMYSSWLDGIVTDSSLMIVPIDDHIVHRGDGVFEAIKVLHDKIYSLDAHLDRLERSANAIHIEIPLTRLELQEIIRATVRAAKVSTAMIRLYVSRGPGGFTTNPYESIGPQVYVVVTQFKNYAPDFYLKGVRVRKSGIATKDDFLARIKSCNYLPNVLMKKEAIDLGVDFTISVDAQGFLAESATENCGVISGQGDFLVPSFHNTLRGVTITRVMVLAQTLLKNSLLRGIQEADIAIGDVDRAREMMMFGTTMDVLPVVEFDGRPIGTGKPGPIFLELQKLLQQDVRNGPGVLTSV